MPTPSIKREVVLGVLLSCLTVLGNVRSEQRTESKHPWGLSEAEFWRGYEADRDMHAWAWCREEYNWLKRELIVDSPQLGRRTALGELIWRGAEVQKVTPAKSFASASFALDSVKGVGRGPHLSFEWKQKEGEVRLTPLAHVVVAIDRKGSIQAVLVSGTLKLSRPTDGINSVFDASWYDAGNGVRPRTLPLLSVSASRIQSLGYHDYMLFDRTGQLEILMCNEWGGAWNEHSGGADSAIEVDNEPMDLRTARVASRAHRKELCRDQDTSLQALVNSSDEWRELRVEEERYEVGVLLQFQSKQGPEPAILPKGMGGLQPGGEEFMEAERLRKATHTSRNLVNAMSLYEKAAALGNSAALHRIGVMYALGEGVPIDHEKCVEFYHKAASAGLAEAQHDLAVRYALGKGVAADEAAAIELYRKAAAQGYEPSIKVLKQRKIIP